MPRLADATAYLKSDNSELKKGLDEGEQEVSGWGGRLGSVLQGVGMAVGMGVANLVMGAAQQVGQFMGESVTAASDLNETVSKTGVVFGDSSAAVLAWAENASTALGQSKQGALDAASGFGNLFVSMGMAAGPSAEMSMNLTQLASDLASFNNISPEEALDKLRAGMLGSAEPLQSLGVNMTAAMVSAQALEMGLAATTEGLTPAMLAQARYALILEQTTTAQGDFARTADGLANQQRVQDAQWKDLQATIGQGLLPIQLALTTALNDLLKAVLPPLSAFMTSTVIPAMTELGNVIARVVTPALAMMTGDFGDLGGGITNFTNGPFAGVVRTIQTALPQVQAAIQRFVDAATAFWAQWGDEITWVVTSTLEWVATYMGAMMQTIFDIVTVVLQLLTGDWESAGNTLQGILSRWQQFFSDAFAAIVRTIQNIDWGGVGRAILDTLWAGMRAAWDSGVDWFEDRLRDLRNMLPFSEPKDPSSPLRGLTKSGEAIVGMIQQGIDQAANWTLPALNGPSMAGAGAGAPISITINIGGGSDAAAVGIASRDGVLAGLRAAGLR
jgi:predicted PurR-regulated permease PerM